MANELKFGNKVVFLNGLPVTLPIATSDPGSAAAGDMYYNSTGNVVKYYNGSSWQALATGGAAANTALSNLAAVAINTSLLPGITNSINLGSASFDWASAYIRLLKDGSSVDSIDVYNRSLNAADGSLAADYAARQLADSSELASLDWETRALIDAAAANQLTWSASGVAFPQLTATTVPYLNGSKILTSSAVTPTELGYLSGVTSAIQTQINAKANDNIVIKKDGSVTYTANQPMGGFKLTGLAAGSTSGDSVRYEQAILASGANAWAANQSVGGFKFTNLAAGTGAGDSVRYEQAILTSGANAFAADQSFGGFNATNLADPLSGQDAVTLAYLQARLAGLKPKQAVRAATTVAGTLASSFEDGDVIDGVTLATGDRILIKDQAAPAQNGIYTVNASGAPTRATDFDSLSPVDEINGAWVAVQEGTANAGIVFTQYGVVATIGTDAINFEYFNPIAGLVGGDMITFTGSVFSVDLATVSGLESTNPGNVAGQLRIKLEASNPSLRFTGSNELAAKLDAAGAIASGAGGLATQVDNSTIEISTNALRLKALGITNAHISATAAIALTKLAAVTANKALASDSSGFIVASAVSDTELGYLSGVTSAIQTQLNGKASTALSNLASVAINTTLVSDTDNTDDLGTDTIEWKDVWAHNLKHNSSGAPNLGIMTTGNNGSIVMTAHGTGNLDILATKLRRAENGAGSNYMEDQYFDSLTLTAGTVAATEISASLSFAVASFDGAVINYRIKEASTNKTRIGQFIVSSDGTIASSSDQFSESSALGSALGLSFSADIDSGNVRILYNNTHASNNATMRCQIRRFRA